jgi:cell division protein ZapA
MPHVTVTISGRSYRMACGEGEEARLEGLAKAYDGKIDELRQAFGEIGDMRLHVMAALTLADELDELRGRMQTLERDLAAATERVGAAEEQSAGLEARLAETLSRTAERVERLAKGLNAPQA